MENKIKELEEKLLRKEQELQEAIDNYVKLDNQRVKEYNVLVAKYNNKEQECEELIKNYFTVIQQRNVAEQQLDQLKKANDEKNELLAQLGCPTVGTARRLTLSLKEQIDKLKVENEGLKTKVFRLESKQTSMGEQNKELIENNLNLSKENAKNKAEIEELKKQLTILDDEDVVVEITVKQFEEYKKYKQALIGVKKIVDGCLMSATRQKILQIISECEGDK